MSSRPKRLEMEARQDFPPYTVAIARIAHAAGDIMSDLWCILRTSGNRTCALERSLAAAGIEVWTPKDVATRRRGRTRERVEFDVPIIPTFVFARADCLLRLAHLTTLPISQHPPFSIFRHAGRIPLIGDREVEGLRREEEHKRVARLKKTRREFKSGQTVRLDEGAFAGMTGIVERGNGKSAVVSFGGNFCVQIATWLLQPDDINTGQLVTSAAA